MRSVDKAQWPRLSPLLDELLDLEASVRAERMAALRAEDAALADDLAELLGRLPGLEQEDFLERPSLLREAEARVQGGLAGRSIGPYAVERELGQGGMGSVWLARRADGRYEGHVAIKFLNVGLAARGGSERFAREGSILARLAHPNIARLLDAGVAADAQPYLVLEYIDGVTIERYCEDNALDLAARVRLFLDVLAAVAHAHNRLILHRDLKPSNILVTAAGEVKLLDFGIAKLLDDAGAPAQATEITQAAGRAFTVQYAAPEQLQNGDVTTATDVYALGVLLYVLLGGTHPTAGRTTGPLDQMRAVIEIEPRRLSEAVLRHGGPAYKRLARALRGDLDNIVARALKKKPAERYANAEAFADDLRRYLDDEPVAARPDGVGYLVTKFVRRHRLGVAASAAIVAALTTGIGVALHEANEARHQRVQAEGLIEFMLGDLRKKLQPVGRLEVLDAVGEKALGYYGAQDAAGLDAASLGRRARALHLIGEIAEQRGNLDEAARTFQRAADSTGELMARYPKDPQRIFDHAQSVYWVGYVARRRGQVTQAEAWFRRYQELAQQLTKLDPGNLDWRVEPAYASQNLGVVFLESARAKEALKSFVETRDVFMRLIGERVELHFDLANTWGWISKAREALGDFSGAIDALRTKVEALHKVPNAERNRNVQRLLANADYDVSRLQFMLGQYREAARSARGALDGFEALSSLDSSNTDWLGQATSARTNLAEIQIALGARGAAQLNLDRAWTDTARLRAIDATQGKWNITLPGILLLQRMGLASDPGSLREEFETYLASVQDAEKNGKTLDAEQLRVVAAAELRLGDLLARPKGAIHWQAAAQRVQQAATRRELPALTLLAHAKLRLGDVQEARSLAERIEASPYRPPIYADLRQRLAHAGGAAPVH
jgi:serine/threonine-protein kinase